MGYNWKKRLGEELKTEKNVRDCGGLERTMAAVRQAGGKRNIRERTGFEFSNHHHTSPKAILRRRTSVLSSKR